MADVCKFEIEPEIINLHSEIDEEGARRQNFQMKIDWSGYTKLKEKMYGRFSLSDEEY